MPRGNDCDVTSPCWCRISGDDLETERRGFFKRAETIVLGSYCLTSVVCTLSTDWEHVLPLSTMNSWVT